MSKKILPEPISCRSCGTAAGFVERFKVPNYAYDGLRPLHVVTCPGCGLCFLNPQYPTSAYSDYYSEDYYGPNASIQAIYEATQSNRAFIDYFEAFAGKLPREGAYLDAGAGTGQWLDFLVEKRPDIAQSQIHVLEPSKKSTDFILQRYPQVRIQNRMLEDNNFPTGYFDGVLYSALIEHLTDPLAGLLHLNRLLAMGGSAMLLTPHLDEHSFAKGPANFFKFVHTFYYSTETLASLVHKAGLEVDTVVVHYDAKLSFYGYLILIVRKVAPRSLEQLAEVRAVTAEDRRNAVLAKEFFDAAGAQVERFRRMFYWMYARRVVKTLITP